MVWEYNKETECLVAWAGRTGYFIEGNEQDGYSAYSTDYEWGIDKVAISFSCEDKSETKFTNLEKLKERIESKTQYWLFENGNNKGLVLTEN